MIHIEPHRQELAIPVLETPRLRLRPHRVADIEAVAAMWALPDVTRFIGSGPRPHGDVWRNLLRHVGSWALLGYGYWVIERRDDGGFVGEIGLMESQRATEPSFSGIPEAGWATVPDAWGRGLATEALTAVMAWADRHLTAPQTCCMFDPDHAASRRVAEKAGFRPWQDAMLGDDPVTLFIRDRRVGGVAAGS